MKGVALAAALGFGASVGWPVLAADGSGSSNQALLRGGYEAGADTSCANAIFCDVGAPVQPTQVTYDQPVRQPARLAPLAQPVDCDVIDLSVVHKDGCGAPVYPSQGPVATPVYAEQVRRRGPYIEPGPQVEADWQIALRGTYDWGSAGSRFGLSVTPQFSVTRQNSRGAIVVGANASLTKEGDTEYRLSSGALDFNADYRLNKYTGLQIGANLGLSQASPFDINSDTNTTNTPIIVIGGADVAVTRQSGRFVFAGRGSFNRTAYGTSELTGGAVDDNSYRNQLGVGIGGRVSYKVGGRVDVFVDGTVDRNAYDAASPITGDKLDSWTFAGRVGATGNWGDVFLAEISAGYGLRRFDSALLSDAPTALVDATLTYRPDGPWELSALFGTEISVPEATTGSTTEVGYTASANALYQVNDRWAVRANLGGSWSRFEGSDETRTGLSAGVGTDFSLNKHTSLNADYTYGFSDSTTNGARDSHRLGLGMTYSR